jgi:hypothetical protein
MLLEVCRQAALHLRSVRQAARVDRVKPAIIALIYRSITNHRWGLIGGLFRSRGFVAPGRVAAKAPSSRHVPDLKSRVGDTTDLRRLVAVVYRGLVYLSANV